MQHQYASMTRVVNIYYGYNFIFIACLITVKRPNTHCTPFTIPSKYIIIYMTFNPRKLRLQHN